jgi:hypothetical protein
MTAKMIDRMAAQLELAIAKQEMPTKRFDVAAARSSATSMQFSLF